MYGAGFLSIEDPVVRQKITVSLCERHWRKSKHGRHACFDWGPGNVLVPAL